ncbi:hypothetical protein BCAR13_1140038 [Paraburkholderia caribensis]|nr:hypothetical protein BCAR13_1140038 [Paraburkholderia caribensis]
MVAAGWKPAASIAEAICPCVSADPTFTVFAATSISTLAAESRFVIALLTALAHPPHDISGTLNSIFPAPCNWQPVQNAPSHGGKVNGGTKSPVRHGNAVDAFANTWIHLTRQPHAGVKLPQLSLFAVTH